MTLIKSSLIFISLLASLPVYAASSDLLVSDTNPNRVDITAQFTGQELLVYGAIYHPGEVVVKLSSPNETVDLHRKLKYGPFWLTGGKLTIKNTPGIYKLLSSRPLNEILPEKVRNANGLVMEDVLAHAKVGEISTNMSDWRGALLRLRQKQGYYLEDGQGVKKIDNRLFVSHIKLPANLPQGSYKLDIYLVDDGKLIAYQQHKFEMTEVQLEGWVSRVAYGQPWLFGIGFTLLAMFGGLGLGIVLRREGNG